MNEPMILVYSIGKPMNLKSRLSHPPLDVLHRKASGFTIIELLVVIAIIAILSTITGAAVNRAIRTAKNNIAIQESQAIANAVELFVREYGWMPVPPGDQGDPSDESGQSLDAVTSQAIMQILLASDDNSNLLVINPRKLSFLELDFAAEDGVIQDPWGNQYLIKLDLDFDEKVTVNGSSQEYTISAIVWSTGPDVSDTGDDIGNVDVFY